jgi:hypothetical protein
MLNRPILAYGADPNERSVNGRVTLRDVDLLPNLDYMDALLRIASRAVEDMRGLDHYSPEWYVSELLYSLCLTRFYNDAVGKAVISRSGYSPKGCVGAPWAREHHDHPRHVLARDPCDAGDGSGARGLTRLRRLVLHFQRLPQLP